MTNRARSRGIHFLSVLSRDRQIPSLPVPVTHMQVEGLFFEMVWQLKGHYISVASFPDGHFEMFVEREGATWEGETMLARPTYEFLKRFRPLCSQPEVEAPARGHELRLVVGG